MKQIRLLCRTAHTYGHHKNKTGFDSHNLRLEELKPDDMNYIPELSSENKIFQNGKAVPQSQFKELLASVKKEQEDNIKLSKGDMTDHQIGKLNLSRSKTKSKLKKWAENSDDIQETMFFDDLLDKVGNEKIDAETEIKKLKSFGKIKRLNNKINAITDLENCNCLIDVKENNSLSMKIISSEKMFKIPDQWKTNVKAEHWNEVINNFHEKYYSNFNSFYTAIHLDENKENPHAHHRMSGFNNKSKSFDLPDHELNLIRGLFNKKGKVDLYPGKKWAQLDPDEVKDFGKKYQTFMFAFCNKELQKLGYDIQAKKRTPDEVKQDNHIYSKSKIRNRIFNGTNKIKENVENWFNDVKNKLFNNAVNLHNEIINDRSDLEKSLKGEVDILLNDEEKKVYNEKLKKSRNKLR